MATHAPPQADADYLSAVLAKAGVLPRGRVTSARSVHSFPTVLSHFHRLKLEYEGAEEAPRHLYLKTGLPDSPGAAMDSGRREVAFYTTVAPMTPPGLLPRCFDAQAADGTSWHLLLEDLPAADDQAAAALVGLLHDDFHALADEGAQILVELNIDLAGRHEALVRDQDHESRSRRPGKRHRRDQEALRGVFRAVSSGRPLAPLPHCGRGCRAAER